MKNAKTTSSASSSVAFKARWDNAVSMARHSLNPSVNTTVPKNFVSCKNAAPRGIQNYDLAITAAVEGYTTNLWATPKQVESIGGVVSSDACLVPIFVEKKSSKGNIYYRPYYVVNLDCVSFPTGSISQDDYDHIIAAANMDEQFVVPSVPMPTPLPSVNTTPITINAVPTKKPVRRVNVLDKTDPTAGVSPADKKVAPVRIDMDEFGIHIEARCTSEAQMMLEMAIKGYMAMKGIK